MKIKSTLMLLLTTAIIGYTQVTKRIYLIGNSVTDGINYGGFTNIALSRGNTHIFGREMTPGAPLNLLWDSQGAFSESPYGGHTNAFTNYTWDCISFQPFDRSISGSEGDNTMITNFLNEAKGKSPNVQAYIYSRYPRKPGDASNFDAALWNKLWLGTYTGQYQSNETRKYFEDLTKAVRTSNPDFKPALIVPVGDVMYALNQKMKAGKLSGYSSMWDTYNDGIHVNNVGSFIIASTFFATMYKQDPRGLSVPSEYGSIATAIRDTITQTVYEVVFSHAYSGTTLNDLIPASSVTISSKSLNINILNSATLTASVMPENAANKQVKWSSLNTAIASVNSKGKVTALNNGTTKIVVTTLDGGFSDTCTINVFGSISGTTENGILAAWDFSGMITNPVVQATSLFNGIESANTDLGNGYIIRDYVGNGLYANDQTALTLNSSIAANEYFSYKIKPQAGKLMNISKIKFYGCIEGPKRAVSLFSNVTGFNTEVVIKSDSISWGSTFTVDLNGFNNISTEVEFRVYIYGNYGNKWEAVGIGNHTDNDFIIEGSILTPVDNEKPSKPTNFLASQVTDKSLNLSWNTSTDNIVVWGYKLFQNNVLLNTNALLQDTTYSVSGLSNGNSYNFKLIAVDYVGNASDTAKITINTNSAPMAVITAIQNAANDSLNFSFNANSSTDPDNNDFILGFEWDFGDGTQHEISNNLSHIFTRPGIYTVKLKVMDNRNLWGTTVSKTIYVGKTYFSAPVAVILKDKEAGIAPLSVKFDAGNSTLTEATDSITAYEWNFGDNSAIVTTPKANHTYNASGTYIVSLKVKGRTTWSDAVTNTITVESGVAVNTVTNNPGFDVYPNPSWGNELHLLYNNTPTNCNVKVTDLAGHVVLECTTNSNSVNVSTLKSGIYFISISNSTQQVVKKLIRK